MLALSLALLLLALGAGSARADTIFFLRAGNIWAANPDGSGQKQVTSDGSYDFVASAKQGSAPRLAFHRGGSAASAFGTMNPDGTGITPNPANSSMNVSNSFYTRLDAAGDRMTWPEPQNTNNQVFFASSVGVDGSDIQQIYRRDSMEARYTTFGDPAGTSLLFTDVGEGYTLGGSTPCSGTDDLGSILVRATTPQPSGSITSGSSSPVVYCDNDILFFTPALSPDGQTIAAEADSDAAGSSGGIVTIPTGGSVANASAQSPLTNITPPNSGDTLPDFSPDGARIAFQGPGDTILTVPAGGGAATQVLTGADNPAWSPYTLPSGGGGGPQTQPGANSGSISGGSGGGGAGGSTETGSCKVPKVVGAKLSAAKRAIVKAGCSVGKITRKRSSRRRRGRVLHQSPAARKVVAAGTKVKLTVGR